AGVRGVVGLHGVGEVLGDLRLEGADRQERGDQQAEGEDDNERQHRRHPALVEAEGPTVFHHAPLLGSHPGFRMRAVSVISTKTLPCGYAVARLVSGRVRIVTTTEQMDVAVAVTAPEASR